MAHRGTESAARLVQQVLLVRKAIVALKGRQGKLANAVPKVHKGSAAPLVPRGRSGRPAKKEPSDRAVPQGRKVHQEAADMNDPVIKVEIIYNKETALLNATWNPNTPIALVQMIVDELKRVLVEQRNMLMTQHMMKQAQDQALLVDVMGKQLRQ